MNVYSQENSQSSSSVTTRVSGNGIMETVPIYEKVPDEDIDRIKDLDKESDLEYNGSENDVEISDEDKNEDDDFDSLFDENDDVETAVTTKTTETVKIDPKDKPITFSGSLKSELGGYVWFYPSEKTKPFASFSNVLKFTGRPTTDFFVTGSLLTEFPNMGIGVYELYFNYTLFGVADLLAGKKDVSWNISRILDTNSLDDTYSNILINQVEGDQGLLTSIFTKRARTTTDSKFTTAFNIPIFSYGSIRGVSQYYGNTSTVSNDYISLAGKIEGTIGKFSIGVYGIRYPTYLDPNKENYNVVATKAKNKNGTLYSYVKEERMNPVLGVEIVSSILGKESNLFVQGQINFAKQYEQKFNHAKISCGVYKYFPNPIMLGIAFEYQLMYHKNVSTLVDYADFGKEPNEKEVEGDFFGTGKDFQNYFASQISWSHFLFGKKWTLGCEWFHDAENEYGAIMPVMKIDNVVKYTNFRVAFPLYYGEEKRYGLVFEAILNLRY